MLIVAYSFKYNTTVRFEELSYNTETKIESSEYRSEPCIVVLCMRKFTVKCIVVITKSHRGMALKNSKQSNFVCVSNLHGELKTVHF